MRVHVAAFTRAGLATARYVARELAAQGDELTLFAPPRLTSVPAAPGERDTGGASDAHPIEGLAAWAARSFASADALLFVCACGIATRAIAPCVRDKFSDPAVVCVDEAARYAIPLLSGHAGGANALARRVAAVCGAQSVVTTATDVNGIFAVDEWARDQGLVVVERALAKRVSATLLEGGRVGFASEWPLGGELPAGLVFGGGARASAAGDGSGKEAGDAPAPAPELGIAVGLDVRSRPFAATLHLVPRAVVVGVGCKRGASAARIAEQVDACLANAGVPQQAVRALATIDVKRDEPGIRELAHERGWELAFFSAEELAAVHGDFASSEFVRAAVGVDNVCERAACARGATLLAGRQAAHGVTVALAAYREGLPPEGATCFPEGGEARGGAASQNRSPGTLTCVGIGPGGADDLTLRAHRALLSSDVIVGYTTYVDLVRASYPQAEFVSTPMRKEVERCREALCRAAAGERVALVCSGDPGVYGMAGLALGLAPAYPGVDVQIVPGVTAANGGAALLGAPLMHDWCVVSLSDLLTPWETIAARLHAAAQADFGICLYNPASHGRADHLRRACDILLEHRSPDTVCGIARSVGRVGQTSAVLTLGDLRDARVDMLTCVFVGNSQTRVVGGRMVTPRGYAHGEV